VICPPAPNSTMLSAHSLHATRCLQGRSTTSRGEDRHNRHSDDGSSSVSAAVAGIVGEVGGYVWVSEVGEDGSGAVGAGVCAVDAEEDVNP
jgi:hypothetical protein